MSLSHSVSRVCHSAVVSRDFGTLGVGNTGIIFFSKSRVSLPHASRLKTNPDICWVGWGNHSSPFNNERLLNCAKTLENQGKITFSVHLLQGLESGDYTKQERLEDKDKPSLRGGACRRATGVNHETQHN